MAVLSLTAAGGAAAYGASTSVASPNCSISPILVNSCRAWLGAAAHGNPGAPNTAVDQFNYLQNKLIGKPLDDLQPRQDVGLLQRPVLQTAGE